MKNLYKKYSKLTEVKEKKSNMQTNMITPPQVRVVNNVEQPTINVPKSNTTINIPEAPHWSEDAFFWVLASISVSLLVVAYVLLHIKTV